MTTGVGGPSGGVGSGVGSVGEKPVTSPLEVNVPVATAGPDGVLTFEFVSGDAGTTEAAGKGGKVPPKLAASTRVVTGLTLSQLAEKTRGMDLKGTVDVMLAALLAAARSESEQERAARTNMAIDKVSSVMNLQASAKIKAEAATTMMVSAGVGLAVGVTAGAISLGLTVGSAIKAAPGMKIGAVKVTGNYTPTGAASPGAPGSPSTAPMTGTPTGGVVPPIPPPSVPSPSSTTAPTPGLPGGTPVTPPSSTPSGQGGRPTGGGPGGGAGGMDRKAALARLDALKAGRKADDPVTQAVDASSELLNKEVACLDAPGGKTSVQAIADQRALITYAEKNGTMTPTGLNAEKNKLMVMEKTFNDDEGVKQCYRQISETRNAIDGSSNRLVQFANSINTVSQSVEGGLKMISQGVSTLTETGATHKEIESRMNESLASSEEQNVQSSRRAVENTLQAVQTIFREISDSFQAVTQNMK